jgi:hypothetical protein
MLSHGEFTKLLEAEQTARLKSQLSRGVYDHLTKQDFSEVIEAFALDIQAEGETSQQAYVRFIEKEPAGRSLFAAYRRAPSTKGHIEKSAYISEIQKLADARFPELPTPQRRFAHAIEKLKTDLEKLA